MTFSYFDIALLVLLIIITLYVTAKGFVVEFFSRAAFLLALLSSFLFYKRLAQSLIPIIGLSTYPSVVSFLLIFIIVYLVIKGIQKVVSSLFEDETMRNLDHALGFFLGIIEGGIVILILILLLSIQPLFDTSQLFEGSILVELLDPLISTSLEYIPPFIVPL